VCCEEATLKGAHEFEQQMPSALVSLLTICTSGTGAVR